MKNSALGCGIRYTTVPSHRWSFSRPATAKKLNVLLGRYSVHSPSRTRNHSRRPGPSPGKGDRDEEGVAVAVVGQVLEAVARVGLILGEPVVHQVVGAAGLEKEEQTDEGNDPDDLFMLSQR